MPEFAEDQLDMLLKFVHSLRSSQDPTVSANTCSTPIVGGVDVVGVKTVS